MGSRALNGDLNRARGWISSQRSDKEERALGGPYEPLEEEGDPWVVLRILWGC